MGFLKLSSQRFGVKEITFLQWLKCLLHDRPWCLVFKFALTINLQRTCNQTASQFQVLCLANKQLRTLLLFKQDSFISNACTIPIKVKESRACLKTGFFFYFPSAFWLTHQENEQHLVWEIQCFKAFQRE